MRTQCLCQICTCGRHHCPHGTTKIYENTGKFCPMTEYLEKYPSYGTVAPPQSLKPRSAVQAVDRGRVEDITTFKSDYRPYEITRPPRHMPEEYQPKAGSVDHDTTYKRDFNPHQVQPMVIVWPTERPPEKQGKLDTVPTYKDDYRVWAVPRRELHKLEHVYQPPMVQFGNPTTSQDDFIPHEIVLQQSCRPHEGLLCPTAPFSGDTSHRRDYVPHELPPRFVRPKGEYKAASQPMESLTTHRGAFQGLTGQAARLCRPAEPRASPKARFAGTTEFRESFPPWEMVPPKNRVVSEYVPPLGTMQLASTSHVDYIPHQATRVLPAKPVPHHSSSPGPFQGISTTHDHFPAWQVSRQGPVRPQQPLPGLSGKFEGLSTFRSHYVPHALVPTLSCRPAQAPAHSKAPFHAVTMYSTEFVPKQQVVCPASFPSPPGYLFANVDSRGHRFFHRLPPTVEAY
ncbi:stabilizer of axonemal microtubules 2 isoform X4 [Sorex araneus]|uniref:stabilizer of axonemal microtubules 2 isoform X4 n=1 Tax=Sorex araneus TaxID=42254 RepID=UPI002433A287|nr:stabilizer of axonemal microtubules 2 isoform X4 [Sorex araneus]